MTAPGVAVPERKCLRDAWLRLREALADEQLKLGFLRVDAEAQMIDGSGIATKDYTSVQEHLDTCFACHPKLRKLAQATRPLLAQEPEPSAHLGQLAALKQLLRQLVSPEPLGWAAG